MEQIIIVKSQTGSEAYSLQTHCHCKWSTSLYWYSVTGWSFTWFRDFGRNCMFSFRDTEFSITSEKERRWVKPSCGSVCSCSLLQHILPTCHVLVVSQLLDNSLPFYPPCSPQGLLFSLSFQIKWFLYDHCIIWHAMSVSKDSSTILPKCVLD